MSEFRKKIEEMETKSKRSRYIYAFALFTLLLFFAWLYFSSTSNAIVAEEQTEIAQKWKTKHKVDSIKKKEINYETLKVQEIIDSIKKTSNNENVAGLINDLEEKIGHIDSYSSDSTIVRYYLRKDSTEVKKSVSALKANNFKLITIEASYNPDKFSNHLFYGSKVSSSQIEMLKKQLEKNGARIDRVVPFFMGYKWKDELMEIGYEHYDEEALAENSKYQVKIYLAVKKGNEEEGDDKIKQIGNLLEFKAFIPKVQPIITQNEIPNFPNVTTIHYFSEEPAVLANANEIADLIKKYFKTDVIIEKKTNSEFTRAENETNFNLYFVEE